MITCRKRRGPGLSSGPGAPAGHQIGGERVHRVGACGRGGLGL